MTQKSTPGTSGLMPTRGSGCGLRPDEKALDTLEQGNGIDFSQAKRLLADDLSQTLPSTAPSIPSDE